MCARRIIFAPYASFVLSLFVSDTLKSVGVIGYETLVVRRPIFAW